MLKRAGIQSLYPILRSRRLRWLGYVVRMDISRIHKHILYGELSEDARNVGRLKLRFKDQCKTYTMEFSINVVNWDAVARDQLGC